MADRPALERPADGRNNAIGAAVIAPLRDLDEGRPGRRGRDAVSRIDRALSGLSHRDPRRSQQVGDPVVPADPDEEIDLGHLFGQLFRVALGQAAGHHEGGPRPLSLGRFQYDRDRFLFGLVDKGARMHDNDIGRLRRRHGYESPVDEALCRRFGVDDVLVAPQCDHTVGTHTMALKIGMRPRRGLMPYGTTGQPYFSLSSIISIFTLPFAFGGAFVSILNVSTPDGTMKWNIESLRPELSAMSLNPIRMTLPSTS